VLPAVLVCVAVGVLFVTRETWLSWMGEYLTYSEPPCKADIIVVLAGDAWGNRVVKGGELQRAGWAPKVLVSGAGTDYLHNEGDLAIEFAVHAGYAADAFVNLPSPARSTEEEAAYIIPEMRRRGVHKFLLVTSDFHTRRASEVYHKKAPDLPFCVVAARDNDFSPDGWWHTREGRKTAFFEWCKTIAHFLGL
jgi:uncharacterized SAM-binding protein YcdF (DUF218 family)